jgi:hypothetical protein
MIMMSAALRKAAARCLPGAPGDKAGDKGGYSEFSFLHKQKMRCWQALAVIAPLISDEHAAICAARVLDAVRFPCFSSQGRRRFMPLSPLLQ